MNIKWTIAQRAEQKWWQRYLRNKDVETYRAWKLGYWQDFLTRLQLPAIGDEAKILDAGCGPAGIYMAYPDRMVTAFDPLIERYENSLPHFKRSFYPSVRFVAGGLEDFDDGEQYDMVFCLNAVNHVADLKKCYRNLTRLLKPGGRLVISIDAHNHAFFKYLFRLLPGDILHPIQCDLAEYTGFLKEQGLTVLQTLRLRSAFFFDYYVQVAEKPA